LTSPALSKAVRKYLDHYAEPETHLLDESFPIWPERSDAKTSQYDYVLVIPAYRESRRFFDRLAKSLLENHAVLLIVVINQPDTLRKPDAENQRLWDGISQDTSLLRQVEHIELRSLPQTPSALLLVDRFSRSPLPKKRGVGLARKIGADLALALINRNVVSQNWIYSTDADAYLPTNYFSVLSNTSTNKAAAAVFPFQHICGPDKIGQATKLYEQRLQQYVNGLQAAGSPYAFHTLGSALAINATSYASVRGFPKRDGGEDFYLLNKAAKTGEVLILQAPKIRIEARQSNRAPFGTGPAINRLLGEEKLTQARIFYHPDVFRQLRDWLQAIPETWSRPINDLALATLTMQALDSLDIDKAIDSTRQRSRTQDTYIKHMHTWFDGFRTLRFIHLLRDSGLHNMSLAERRSFDKPDALSKITAATTQSS
jgi:hypothetical protein